MASPQILSYDDALGMARGAGTPRILLGNGFSIACCPNIFTYRALLEEADFSNVSPEARQLFEAYATQDFEAIIRTLENSAFVVERYGGDTGLRDKMRRDALAIKEELAKTIAKRHPEAPDDIQDSKYGACRQFLSSFSTIYSVSYDLLLYWTIMQDDPSLPQIPSDDGFRTDADDDGFVTWDSLAASQHQNVYFLHGALHLFDAQHKFIKYTWKHTGVRLIEQIRTALDRGRFPRVVAEGTADAKLAGITHCAYLHKGLRSLQGIGGDLFTFGLAFSPNDAHLVSAILNSTVRRLFVGIFGDPATEANQALMLAVEDLVQRRLSIKPRSPLEVIYYDAATAHPWG